MKKILIIVPDGGMLFESAGIADILMQANRLHPETSAGGSVYGRDGTRHLSAENEAGIFLIITSVADQARLIHTAGGALSNEHFIWHPVTRSVRKCNSSKICRTVQAAGVAE